LGQRVWDEWRQRKGLRAAFGAEIGALLKIAETRRHEENAEAMLAAWRRGQDFLPVVFGTPDDDPVFSRNVDKIGLLGSDAAEVVLFYTQLKAVRVNLRFMERGHLKDFSPDRRIAWVESALTIWRETKPIGQQLVRRLSKS